MKKSNGTYRSSNDGSSNDHRMRTDRSNPLLRPQQTQPYRQKRAPLIRKAQQQIQRRQTAKATQSVFPSSQSTALWTTAEPVSWKA